MQDLTAIVLAAGRGTRMHSKVPKVLHKILGEPLLAYPLRLLSVIGVERQVVVIGGDTVGETVKSTIESSFKVDWAVQETAKGTADAVAAGLQNLEGISGSVLILCGDVPLLTVATLKHFYDKHCQSDSKMSILTAVLNDGASYGRVLIDAAGAPSEIVEAKDATAEQLAVKRINSGTYIVDIDLLREALAETGCDNAQGEYYLTDMVAFARRRGVATAIYDVEDSREILGINTRSDLILLESFMASRISSYWLENGVTVRSPESVLIGPDVEIGQDSEISPGVCLLGATAIGDNCYVGTGAQIKNTTIADNVEIKPYSVLEDAEIGERAMIGPFARIRPGSVIGAEAKIGNFVETKKVNFGRGAKASHLAYIGDADVGAGSNLGAGTITCNYDGFNKFKTVIGARVFVGSDSQLVAPVTLGDDVLVGAGSTVTKDVAANAIVTTRTRQKEFPGKGMAWRRHTNEEK